MNIRHEKKDEYYEVENITRKSFWNKYRPGCFEHLVVHNLRNNTKYINKLSYIIEEDNKIIESIVYALGKIKLINGKSIDALIFGPASILPSYQHKGYGKELINFTLDLAKEYEYPFVLITGDNNYYKKF